LPSIDVFILSWLTFAGIPHAAIDTDVQHHTLSDRYKMHLLDATSSEDEFEQLLENLPESPTLIVDFPGNKTSKILEFADHFQMLNSFRASGIRPTLLIFTADDSTAKDSALETLEFFGDAADYLLVENSARFESDSFKATPLYDEFVARNSPTLVVPRISAGTLNAREAAQHRLGKYLSLDKISKADGLNVTSVLELTGVRDRFLVGCEDCASHIILSAAECAASTGLLKEFALPPSIFASKDVRPFTIFTEFMNRRPPPKSLRPRHKR